MEPQRNELASPESTPEQKKPAGRFQIVKLEERIAPNKGGIPNKTIGGRCYNISH